MQRRSAAILEMRVARSIPTNSCRSIPISDTRRYAVHRARQFATLRQPKSHNAADAQQKIAFRLQVAIIARVASMTLSTAPSCSNASSSHLPALEPPRDSALSLRHSATRDDARSNVHPQPTVGHRGRSTRRLCTILLRRGELCDHDPTSGRNYRLAHADVADTDAKCSTRTTPTMSRTSRAM